jgi:signal transduction histidine kinase
MASAMLAAVALIAALAFWDEKRESSAALEDFAMEQATLARALGAELQVRLTGAKEDVPVAAEAHRLATDLRAAERPGEHVVLVLPPGEQRFYATTGRVIESGPLFRGFAAGASTVRLRPEEAAALGLPRRMALAGLSAVDAGRLGRWGVAATASAERQRDRERRARLRLILAVALASGLVLVFGGFALRQQRKELELERELAIADLQRAGDEALAKSHRIATLGTFAVGIAHEISTPLGVIAGRAEQVLPRVAEDERAGRALRAILDQIDRINRVIRGFLSLARGDQPASEPAAPAGIVRSAMALVEHRFARAGVMLSADVPDDLPAVCGDARLIEHALTNLLLNACDACERGGTVEIVVRGGANVSFSVVDDGVGITPEAAQRATEPFFTTKPSGQGSGLGLALVNEIVNHHRGTFVLAPRTPRGTIARMDLPAAAGSKECSA